MFVCRLVSGVRSSCEASATKRRCVSSDSSSAASIVLKEAPRRRELVVPALGNALARLAGLGDSLGRVAQPAHRSERRSRDRRGRHGGSGDRAERDEDQDDAQPFERPVGRLQALDDEDGSVRLRPARRTREAGPAGRSAKLLGRRCRGRSRSACRRRSGDGEHLSVVGGGKVETRRRNDAIALGVDHLDQVPAVVSRAADAPRDLHRMRRAAQRTVELSLELVPHHEVRRRAGERHDDGDDAGGDERQAGAKGHGSRNT